MTSCTFSTSPTELRPEKSSRRKLIEICEAATVERAKSASTSLFSFLNDPHPFSELNVAGTATLPRTLMDGSSISAAYVAWNKEPYKLFSSVSLAESIHISSSSSKKPFRLLGSSPFGRSESRFRSFFSPECLQKSYKHLQCKYTLDFCQNRSKKTYSLHQRQIVASTHYFSKPEVSQLHKGQLDPSTMHSLHQELLGTAPRSPGMDTTNSPQSQQSTRTSQTGSIIKVTKQEILISDSKQPISADKPDEMGEGFASDTLLVAHEPLDQNITGITSLCVWKSTKAGRSKSWRRSSSTIRLTSTQCAQDELGRVPKDSLFFKVLNLLPAIFVQSRLSGQSYRRVKKGRVPCRDFLSRNKWQRALSIEAQPDEHYDTVSNDASHPDLEQEDGQIELTGAFLRLTWKGQILVHEGPQVDHFIPSGLVFHHRWQIESFLRNDSHADVYAVRDININEFRAKSSTDLEAHLFLHEHHGNSGVFARRRKNRMHRSPHYLQAFWYDGRHVFIMATEDANNPVFRLAKRDFPSLLSSLPIGDMQQRRREVVKEPTYAMIVRGLQTMQRVQNQATKSFDEIQTCQDRKHPPANFSKRSLKQRRKRHAKRDERRNIHETEIIREHPAESKVL